MTTLTQTMRERIRYSVMHKHTEKRFKRLRERGRRDAHS